MYVFLFYVTLCLQFWLIGRLYCLYLFLSLLYGVLCYACLLAFFCKYVCTYFLSVCHFMRTCCCSVVVDVFAFICSWLWCLFVLSVFHCLMFIVFELSGFIVVLCVCLFSVYVCRYFFMALLNNLFSYSSRLFKFALYYVFVFLYLCMYVWLRFVAFCALFFVFDLCLSACLNICIVVPSFHVYYNSRSDVICSVFIFLVHVMCYVLCVFCFRYVCIYWLFSSCTSLCYWISDMIGFCVCAFMCFVGRDVFLYVCMSAIMYLCMVVVCACSFCFVWYVIPCLCLCFSDLLVQLCAPCSIHVCLYVLIGLLSVCLSLFVLFCLHEFLYGVILSVCIHCVRYVLLYLWLLAYLSCPCMVVCRSFFVYFVFCVIALHFRFFMLYVVLVFVFYDLFVRFNLC